MKQISFKKGILIISHYDAPCFPPMVQETVTPDLHTCSCCRSSSSFVLHLRADAAKALTHLRPSREGVLGAHDVCCAAPKPPIQGGKQRPSAIPHTQQQRHATRTRAAAPRHTHTHPQRRHATFTATPHHSHSSATPRTQPHRTTHAAAPRCARGRTAPRTQPRRNWVWDGFQVSVSGCQVSGFKPKQKYFHHSELNLRPLALET